MTRNLRMLECRNGIDLAGIFIRRKLPRAQEQRTDSLRFLIATHGGKTAEQYADWTMTRKWIR